MPLTTAKQQEKWSKDFDKRPHCRGGIFHPENLIWHLTGSVASQSERWSTACGEILMVRPLGMVLGSMRENPDVTPLKSAPFHGGIRTPIQYTVPWAHLSPHPKWHLDQFSRFRRAHVHYRQTNQQKNRPCYSVCSNKLVLRCSLITPPPPQLIRPYFRDHPGESVPEESFFWTLWC